MSDSAPERIMDLGRRRAALPERGSPGPVRAVLYRDGRRERETDTVAEARGAAERDPGLMAWISMTAPHRDQLTEVARLFGLPSLALEDAIVAHQRPKAEVYRGVLFLVLRPARYDTVRESVEVDEIHLFAGRDFVVTIGHTEHVDFESVRDFLEAEPRVLAHGTLAVVHAVLDLVVDGYAPVVSELQDDIDEVENQVFGGDSRASRRTYRLAREVILLSRAVEPLGTVLDRLMGPLAHDPERPGPPDPRPFADALVEPEGTRPPARRQGFASADPFRIPAERRGELHHRLRDVADHVAAVRERVDGFRQLLQNIMSVNSALIDQAQNEAMKKVSSWGGILVVPTLISSVYGMNISPGGDYHWAFSWPLSLALMALTSLSLYLVFRRNGWL
ncbi:magnesium and cobalt transport protein CorA [Nocardiopsis sp. HUAS JQ3]|uniref:magnesium and cobalt transport protein CorA n=1 Tax=Nocardiopsis sp. HUAS JQ3 TaxID=3061629 RepID=UPI0023AA167D|nr:magnesium and cobalt transport protein CorA [Nocardiopsis sp. HUAS JQ3]WDZ88682.1 magnesium and cobalt transport protein CorA [Nocardiopsis sp. HUAS JQ3]